MQAFLIFYEKIAYLFFFLVRKFQKLKFL